MADDPAGYYATLEVNRAATPEEIAAAFRRKARMLHPDVPGTGDAAAFIRVRQAYDVLSDAGRRAAYDRVATADLRPAARGSGIWELPLVRRASLGGLLCLAVVVVVIGLSRGGPSSPQPPARRPAASATPAVAAVQQPRIVTSTSGRSTHYVSPAGDDATVWRYDTARDTYLPMGHVPAFSSVQALHLVPLHGLVEIELSDGGTGFVDAGRLTPGDGATAHRAYCAYNAGPAPKNGEVFRRHGSGTNRVEISNRGALPAVVRLRDSSGQAAATVFVAPRASAVVDHLPESVYRPDFAVGELWSRACNSFAAGMRARRFAFYASPSGLSPLVIPPDLSVAPAPEDIPDAEFERE